MEENFNDISLEELLGIGHINIKCNLNEKQMYNIEELEEETKEIEISIPKEINEIGKKILNKKNDKYFDKIYSREIIHYKHKKKYNDNLNLENKITKLTKDNFNFKSRKEILGEK